MTFKLERASEGNGVGYKAVEALSGAVAGIFLVTFPKDSEENLGRDLGLSERNSFKTDWRFCVPYFRMRNANFRQTVIKRLSKIWLTFSSFLRILFITDDRSHHPGTEWFTGIKKRKALDDRRQIIFDNEEWDETEEVNRVIIRYQEGIGIPKEYARTWYFFCFSLPDSLFLKGFYS